MGVPIALIAAFTNSGFALAMLVVVGIGNVLVDVAGLTLLQRVDPAARVQELAGDQRDAEAAGSAST